jgi:hypothetical protein
MEVNSIAIETQGYKEGCIYNNSNFMFFNYQPRM